MILFWHIYYLLPTYLNSKNLPSLPLPVNATAALRQYRRTFIQPHHHHHHSIHP